MNNTGNILKKDCDTNNKCDRCNQRIHPNFIGYQRCGYANCPVCKNTITNSEYRNHIRLLHPVHENDRPLPLLPRTTYRNRQRYRNRSSSSGGSNHSGSNRSLNSNSADAIELKAGKEYQVDITKTDIKGNGVAKIEDRVIFIKGGYIGEQIKIMITETGNRKQICYNENYVVRR